MTAATAAENGLRPDDAKTFDAGTTTNDSDIAESTGVGEIVAHELAAGEGTGRSVARLIAYGVLPALAMALAATAGFLKWQVDSARSADLARIETVQVAMDATIRLLSYQPGTVQQELESARTLLTGEFSKSYDQLIYEVVIPAAEDKQISAVATVPAAASVSTSRNHAEALVFVNQTVIVDNGAPTATTSCVQVTLSKIGDRWLISGFDPV